MFWNWKKNQGMESKVIENVEVITEDQVANVKLPSRGKRPTVQINAKEAQLFHSNEILPYPTNPHTFIHHADIGDWLSLRQSRQAAAEDENIVVRGSDHGRTMTQEVMKALAHRPLLLSWVKNITKTLP